MKVLITESQYIQILKESKENEITSKLEESRNFVRQIMSEVKNQYNLDFTFATTWGTVIGGFSKPISDYLYGLHPELTSGEMSLIIFGIIMTFFSSNKEKLQKVLELIKEKKLVTFFNQGLMKAYDLRDALFSFLESLNITFSRVSSMIAYSFLIPLVPVVFNIAATRDFTPEQIEVLAKGASHWAITTIPSKVLYHLVKKMITRFRSRV
jgi:hypothetical protein